MTISELIRRCEELKEKHGDIDVFLWDECTGECDFTIAAEKMSDRYRMDNLDENGEFWAIILTIST